MTTPLSPATPLRHARLALRIDALVEAILAGCAAALAVRAPRHGDWRLPGPVTPTATGTIAGGLLVVAAVLWRLSYQPTRQLLVILATANAITAVATIWLTAVTNTGTAIRLLLTAATLALAALALTQTLLARHSRPHVR